MGVIPCLQKFMTKYNHHYCCHHCKYLLFHQGFTFPVDCKVGNFMMRSKIKSWILSRTIWYYLRELGFQVSVPNLSSKAGTSTEETLKTTDAPETGETTSRPGKFISFDLKFNNMPPWYYIHVLYFNQQKYHSPQQKSQQKPWKQLKHPKQVKQTRNMCLLWFWFW